MVFLSPSRTICGCRSSLCSMTTVPMTPVASSVSRRMVTARDHVAELHLAGFLRQDRHVVRVPLGEGIAFLDLRAFAERDHRTDDHVVAFQFAARPCH